MANRVIPLSYEGLGVSTIERIVEDSTLTSKQVEALTIYKRVLSGEFTLKQAAATIERGPVTVGSLYRVIGQGRHKMRASIATVVISLIMGYVKPQDLRRLVDLVSQGTTALGEEGLDQAVPLISALIEKIVM